MTERGLDRRVRRTRQQLREALLSLMRERGYEVLTVQDILDRADVGRSTFYAHFDGKDDLLVSGLEELRSALEERQQQARRNAPAGEEAFAFSRELFAHAEEHRDLFRGMVGKHSGAVVQGYVRRMLVDLVREDVRAMARRGAARELPVEAGAQFLGGGLFGLLMWWVGGTGRPSVDQVTAIFRGMAVAALDEPVTALRLR